MFFAELQAQFDFAFIDDFLLLLNKIDCIYYDYLIDQLLASQSRIFFGVGFSRIRAYHADKNKSKGHNHGIISSYYAGYQVLAIV